MISKNSDHYFLRGGGEMGELIRAKDWSQTSLGDPADWPQSLCTMISVVLDNPFGMYIAWGREYIQLYNDGFRPILGANKHPRALGISTTETFSEIWDTISSMFEGVMSGVPVRYTDLQLFLNRNGYDEECYFDFSYSPIRKENGEVGGILVTVIETTNKKKTEEKLKDVNLRFRNTMKQAPVGITILHGPQYIVEMANDAYLQLVDRKESEFVGNPLFDSLPEVKETVHSLLDNVLNTGIPFHGNELPIPLNRYGKPGIFYFDFIYYPLKEEDGKISGIIVVVTEVTDKVEIRKKIEEGKRLYETITQNTPDLIYVFDLDYRFTYANEALLNMWGRTWEDSIGKSLLANGYEPWHAEMHEREIDQVVATKKPVRGEVSFPHATLGSRIYDYIFVPVIDQDGKVEAIAGTTRDITHQVNAWKQIEASEIRFRNMVEHAPVAISVLRGEDYIVEVANEKQLQLWGTTKEQVLDIPIFTAIPEGRGQGFEEMLRSVFVTGKAFIATEIPTTLTRNGKKETFYSNFTYEPLFDSDHTINGIISIVTEVTEQVLARKKIEDSEQRFKLALSGGTQIIFSQDKNLKHTWIYNSHPGSNGDEIIGKTDNELHTPPSAAILTTIKQNVLDTGTAFNGDVEIEMNGKKANFTMHIEATKDVDGNINGIIGTAIDITERIKSQQKIIESEERFRSLAETLPQLVWVTDAKGNSEFTSKRWKDYSGIEPFGEKEWKAIVHPEDYDDINNTWIRSLTTGNSYNFDVRLKNKKGEYRWHRVKGEPVLDKENNIIKWVGAFTDNHAEKTFSKELEEKVITRTQELKASEEKFHTLFNLSPICKTLSDSKEGKIIMINDAFTNTFGYSREEILHKTSAEIGMLDPHARQTLIDELKAYGKIQNKEIEFIKKSGEPFFALTSAEIIHIEDKQYFLAAYNDISEIKKAEQNIKQKNIELEKMNKELQSFAYISSHDLQEPLRKIQTFASRIVEKEYEVLSENARDNFKRMQEAAKRMQTLIQDLLTYSHTSTSEGQFEHIDLNEVIDEIKSDLNEDLIDKHATIEATDMCDAYIIPFQFRQLMHNLIGNALKFSKPTEPPYIKIKSEIGPGLKFNNTNLSPQKLYCHISVSDNGIGFEQKYSEKIFDVFQRLHGKLEYSGTGIGLSIVKKIIENHHGIITAKGEPNQGATFDIYIPST